MSHSKSTLRRRVVAVVASLTLAVSALPASADSHPEVITPDSATVTKDSSGTAIAGLEVAGFDSGSPVFVSVSVPSGDLGATAQGAASVTDDSDLLRVSGSVTDVNATLATLTFTPDTGSTEDVNVTVTAFASDSEPAFYSGTGHYYEYVADSLTWELALTAASARTLAGRQGYLVTVTSQEEDDFVESKLQADGWMGASDRDVEGEWRWEAGPEDGVVFWTGNSTGTAETFANWATGEPNDYDFGEDGAQFYSSGNGWNDLPHTSHSLPGYVVEYGGMEGDTPSDVTANFTIVVYDVPSAPTAVSTTSGNSTLDVTWTAPAGDEPITGYRVSLSDDAGANWVNVIEDTGTTLTSATVTGLTNGIEHMVRVAAINDAGVGPWSIQVAGTPAAPPAPPPPAPPPPAEPDCSFDPPTGTLPEDSCWEEPVTVPPTDVTADWQVEAATFAVANGIVRLNSDGSIGVEDSVNRRDIAGMLYLLAGSPAASKPHAFDDEGDNPAVDWLASLGVVEGVGGFPGEQFEPLRSVYRGEVVVLLWRISGSPIVANDHGFPDRVPSWADHATSWAKVQGIVVGKADGTFKALGTATKAEVLVMIHRWITTTG